MNKKVNIRFVVLSAIIFLLGIWRVLRIGEEILPWNFTPVGAIALFGGTYFGNRYKAYLFPLFTLFVSDLVLMQVVYAEHSSGLLYRGWMWTYGSFLVMVFIGRLLSKKVTLPTFLLSAFFVALAHYLITDLGVWLAGGLDVTTGLPYPKTWEGFVRCYVMAIPYFKNMLLSTLFFGAILFGGFEWVQHKFPILRVFPSMP